MSTRSTRRPQAQIPLSPLESLLIAQATWELGASTSSWQAVAKLLSKHPLLSRPKSFFNAQSCQHMYEQLMKDAELELSELNESPHAPMNLKLAEKHFRSRHTELRELILMEESKFKTIVKEIEDIRAGLWDKKIGAEVTGKALPDEEPTESLVQEQKIDGTQPSDEIFDGSELSGVTESAESASSTSNTKDELALSSMNGEQVQLQDAVTPPADTPKRNSTPQRNMKSQSPPLPPGIAEGLPGTTSQEEEMPPETGTVNSPPTSDSHTPSSGVVISSSVAEDVDMQSPEKNEDIKDKTPEVNISPDDEGDSEGLDQHTGKKQEEEEEEMNQEDESKEEEEEASQGRQEGLSIDNNSEGEVNPRSPKPSEPDEDQEQPERAHTPTIEVAASAADLAPNEGHSSESEEEPREPTRRSTRRRKSSVTLGPPLPTRKRLRSQARLSESEPRTTVDSENEDESELRDADTPQPEDEVSSPFDGIMTRRREGKRKASFLDNVDSPSEKKRMREDSEPVDEDEPGPSSHNTRGRITRQGIRTEEQVALKRFQNVIGMLHSQISQHRNGNIFHNPIKNSEAPDYHEIVKRPMDLKTIKTRVKDGIIANSLEFQRDIFLMFANSMMYNRPGSDVYAMAEDMMLESEGQIIAFRQTEGMVKRGQRP